MPPAVENTADVTGSATARNRRSVLITGCSSGIGLDGALTLHRRGWRVFATCRKQEDCERLVAGGLESFPLDQADPKGIRAAVAEALARTSGTLDALVCNGAHALPAAMEDTPRDALRALFEVNLFGVFDAINAVLPTMRAQGHGRVVNISSVLGIVAVPFRGPYSGTKFAMEAMTDAMRLELHGTGLHFTLIQPGPISTRIRENAVPHFERWIDWEKSPQRRAYEEAVIPRLYAQKSKPDRFELPPSAVTGKLVHALESARPRRRYRVTTLTHAAEILRRTLSTGQRDRVLRGR